MCVEMRATVCEIQSVARNDIIGVSSDLQPNRTTDFALRKYNWYLSHKISFLTASKKLKDELKNYCNVCLPKDDISLLCTEDGIMR